MAKKNRGGGGGGSWLDTYADMVTLLLTFFVMLFSMSSVEKDKWEALVQSFNPGDQTNQIVVTPEGTGNSVGTNKGGATDSDAITEEEVDFETLFEYLKQYVQQNNLEGSVEVNEGESSVYIRFSNAIFFNADSYILRNDAHKILDFMGNALKKVEPELLSVMIAGHTAYVDGPYGVNDRMLSSQRAANVAIYLEDKKELDPTKIQANGYGANYPIGDNKTPEGREKNRRVEFLILSNKADLTNSEIVEFAFKGTYDETKYPAKGGAGDVVIPNADKEGTTKADTPADLKKAEEAQANATPSTPAGTDPPATPPVEAPPVATPPAP